MKSIDNAAIWVRPYKDGQKAPGYKAHHLIPVDSAKNSSGIVTGWFQFNKPTEIDEIRVYMEHLDTGKIVKEISYDISAKWTGQ